MGIKASWICLVVAQALLSTYVSSKPKDPPLHSGKPDPNNPTEDLEIQGVDKPAEEETRDFDKYPVMKWDNGIPFVLDRDSYTSESDVNTILKVIKKWNKEFKDVPNAKFLEKTPSEVKDFKDYVFITNGPTCESSIGRIGGKQSLFLTQGLCINHRSILHEMFHTLGFIHEQNRRDRDDYIYVHLENLSPSAQIEFTRIERSDVFNLLSEYDYYSVLHLPATSKKGHYKNAFDVLKKDVNADQIGHGHDLSVGDKNKVRDLYME